MSTQIEELQKVSYFVGALASACEANLGKGSHSICSLAGKKFGREAARGCGKTDDPFGAIEMLGKALRKRGIVWDFEPFAGENASAAREQDGKKRIRLAFRSCMVRNALFRYSHEQKQSLCYMAHGVFAGAMEEILAGTKAELEIVHAGPNACLKELVLEEKS